jgi:hypothetical protein
MRVLVSRKTEHFRAGIKYSKAATFQSCSDLAAGWGLPPMRARTLRVSTIGDRSVQASLRRPLPLIVSEPAVTGDVSRGRRFGEHRHRAAPSAFVVVHCADRFARRLHCQLAGLALGLPRYRPFLRHGATVAGHSKSAVDDLSVPGVEQRVPIWQSRSVSRQRRVPRLFSRLRWLA